MTRTILILLGLTLPLVTPGCFLFGGTVQSAWVDAEESDVESSQAKRTEFETELDELFEHETARHRRVSEELLPLVENPVQKAAIESWLVDWLAELNSKSSRFDDVFELWDIELEARRLKIEQHRKALESDG